MVLRFFLVIRIWALLNRGETPSTLDAAFLALGLKLGKEVLQEMQAALDPWLF